MVVVLGASVVVVLGAAYCCCAPSEAYCPPPSSWAPLAKELSASIATVRTTTVADKVMRFKAPPSSKIAHYYYYLTNCHVQRPLYAPREAKGRSGRVLFG